MKLQNGYKKIYEKAIDGQRTFYATTSNVCNPETDVVLGSFSDEEYKGKVIYEYKGKFYVSSGKLPVYDENGEPAESETQLTAFDEIFVEAESKENASDEESEEELKEELVTE